MRKIVLMVIAAAFLAGCKTTPEKTPEQTQSEERQKTANIWNERAAQISYFKDARPEGELCFGYFWQLGAHSPTVFTVPCQSVKKMLINP